jgi:hypothetical protein
MLIRQMDFVVDYVAGLNSSLKKLKTSSLTQIQCNWLVTVLMGAHCCWKLQLGGICAS